MNNLESLESSASDICSLNEMARQFGVSEPTIRNYVAKGMPYVTKADRTKGQPWEFSLSECLEWFEDQQAAKQSQQAAQQEDEGIIAARIAKLNVETDRLQLRLAKERGEVVPIEKVAEIVESQMTTLRTHLLALPIKLAPILTGQTDTKVIKDTVSSYIREALEELAEDRVMEDVIPDVDEDMVDTPEESSKSSVATHLDSVFGIEDAFD